MWMKLASLRNEEAKRVVPEFEAAMTAEDRKEGQRLAAKWLKEHQAEIAE
jgi:ABC-type proline/glycine betaine transport system substrate-binding protein